MSCSSAAVKHSSSSGSRRWRDGGAPRWRSRGHGARRRRSRSWRSAAARTRRSPPPSTASRPARVQHAHRIAQRRHAPGTRVKAELASRSVRAARAWLSAQAVGRSRPPGVAPQRRLQRQQRLRSGGSAPTHRSSAAGPAPRVACTVPVAAATGTAASTSKSAVALQQVQQRADLAVAHAVPEQARRPPGAAAPWRPCARRHQHDQPRLGAPAIGTRQQAPGVGRRCAPAVSSPSSSSAAAGRVRRRPAGSARRCRRRSCRRVMRRAPARG